MNRCLSLLLLTALWMPVRVYAYPPPDRSFVQERIMLDESGSRYLSGKRCYYDGLGNLCQVWHMGVTPAGANLITHIEYDKAGRPVKNWLPVPVSGDVINALPVETVRNSAEIFYGQDSCFYSETQYESSPLGRVEKVYGPGQEWRREGGHCERVGYLVNTAQGEYSARYFYEFGGNLRASGNYPAGSLYISQRTDEDGNVSYTFTDKMGQIVLVRRMEGAVPHDTYHVYNDYGDKVFMLSPKAADALSDGWWTADQEPVKELAYIYRYDARRRCTAKKYPGADWIYYVYDHAGRPIFSQDGNQRVQGVWTFIVPDAMGRPVITGTCKNISTPVVNDKIITASWDGTIGGSFKQTGYVLPEDLPLDSPEVNIVSYYDNYDFKKVSLSFSGGALYNYAMPSGIPDARYGTDESVHEHKGLLTGQEVRELGSSSRYLTVFYYDAKGRMIQCIAGNTLGGADKESTAYNFTGQPVMRIHEQYKKSSQPLQTLLAFTETYTYVYDHAGRPVTVKHKINDQAEQVISSLTYNELGQLAQKKQGGISPLSYTYNIRGWLTRIQAASLFEENLYYTFNPNPGDDVYYNGNISAVSFSGIAKKGNGQSFRVTKNMSYRYDGLNRLKAAEMKNSHDGFDLYFELYNYDKNGNILSLARSWKDSQEDELTFTYTGNRMTSVFDAGNDMYLSSVPQIPCNIYNGAFSYDANGNRTKDEPRKIKSLTFNELNLPREFQMTGGEYMKVRYSADGRKLGTESRWYEKGVIQPGELMALSGGTGQAIVEKYKKYAANAVYESPVSGMDILDKIYIDGGYLTYDKSALKYVYHYYYQDHLGSNCVVRNESGATEQSADYLPSGIPTSEFGPLTVDNRLHVNMEFESLLGIHLYDNGARWRDPVYNVFISPDPLCEKFPGLSPYAVCAGNPMRYIDSGGDRINIDISGKTYSYMAGTDGQYGFYDDKGELYKGDDAFAKALSDALNSLRKYDVGKGLVDELVNSDNVLMVEKDLGIGNAAYLRDSKVYWDPDKWVGGLDEDGKINRKPFIGLGHEFAHVSDIWNKTVDKKSWYIYRNEEGEEYNVPMAEIYACYVENQIRNEHRLPLRIYYQNNEVDSGYSPVESSRVVKVLKTDIGTFYMANYWWSTLFKVK